MINICVHSTWGTLTRRNCCENLRQESHPSIPLFNGAVAGFAEGAPPIRIIDSGEHFKKRLHGCSEVREWTNLKTNGSATRDGRVLFPAGRKGLLYFSLHCVRYDL